MAERWTRIRCGERAFSDDPYDTVQSDSVDGIDGRCGEHGGAGSSWE